MGSYRMPLTTVRLHPNGDGCNLVSLYYFLAIKNKRPASALSLSLLPAKWQSERAGREGAEPGGEGKGVTFTTPGTGFRKEPSATPTTPTSLSKFSFKRHESWVGAAPGVGGVRHLLLAGYFHSTLPTQRIHLQGQPPNTSTCARWNVALDRWKAMGRWTYFDLGTISEHNSGFAAWARRVHSSERRTRDVPHRGDTVLGTRFSLFQAEPMKCSASRLLKSSYKRDKY